MKSWLDSAGFRGGAVAGHDADARRAEPGRRRGSSALVGRRLGDTANIASRLESFDKEAHDPVNNRCRVLIGETTLRYLDGRFRVTEMGRVKFKGKQQEIAVYRVDE